MVFVMTPQQAKAARTWLGWTQPQLAEKAGVGISTILDYETGRRTPIPNNLKAIQSALEEAGIEFAPDSISRRGKQIPSRKAG